MHWDRRDHSVPPLSLPCLSSSSSEQFLVGKFWDLMHEKDRPWHYEAILHLCFYLPKPAKVLYRKLKPSSMQRILATRARVRREETGLGNTACNTAHSSEFSKLAAHQ